MTRDTRIALLLMGKLVAALRANDPDLFMPWRLGGMHNMGVLVVSERLLDWLEPFLTLKDRAGCLASTEEQALCCFLREWLGLSNKGMSMD